MNRLEVVTRQIQEMLCMQDELNRKIHPEWQQQNYAWNVAVMVECSELIDHLDWKWWKKQPEDSGAAQLEAVDIWHFGLSMLLGNTTALGIARVLVCTPHKKHTVVRAATLLGGRAAYDALFYISCFRDLIAALGMSFEDLYRMYVGKHVLNHFRADHQYKEGNYQKDWYGFEDNDHLIGIVKSLNPELSSFKQDIYARLASVYSRVCPELTELSWLYNEGVDISTENKE